MKVCMVSKVRGPNLVTHLKRAPKFECESKHGHQEDEEIGLRAQRLLTILGSIDNIIVGGSLYNNE